MMSVEMRRPAAIAVLCVGMLEAVLLSGCGDANAVRARPSPLPSANIGHLRPEMQQNVTESRSLRAEALELQPRLEESRASLQELLVQPPAGITSTQLEVARQIARELDTALAEMRSWQAALDEGLIGTERPAGAFDVLAAMVNNRNDHPHIRVQRAVQNGRRLLPDLRTFPARVSLLRSEVTAAPRTEPSPPSERMTQALNPVVPRLAPQATPAPPPPTAVRVTLPTPAVTALATSTRHTRMPASDEDEFGTLNRRP